MTCNCNRTGDVEYQITLDAQGPQGRQGNAGPEGFSPIIDIYSNTEANYQLKIISADGEIITPNLKGQTPELPDGLVDVNTSNVFRDVNYFEKGIDTNSITIRTPETNYRIDTALNDITVTKTDNATGNSEANIIAYKKDLEDYVTLDTTQTITGSKTFNNGVIVSSIDISDGNTTYLHSRIVETNLLKYLHFDSDANGTVFHNDLSATGLHLADTNGQYCLITNNSAVLPTNTYITRVGANNQVLTPNLIQAGEGITLTFDGKLTISSTGGGAESYITSATAPLNVTEGNLTLAIDNQTIQVNTEGKLVANLAEIGNELNGVANRVTSLETEVTNLSGEVAGNTADIATIRGSLGNNLISKLTATEYSNLVTKDSNTLYIVVADDNSNFTMYYGEIPMYMPSGGGGDNASQKTYIANVDASVSATKVV